ncbi:MAG: hypothetical protein ABH836_07440 [Candidatus Omnitrophota bacterium]
MNANIVAADVRKGNLYMADTPKKDDVRTYLNVNADYELMAVITIGYPAETKERSSRKNLNDFILNK